MLPASGMVLVWDKRVEERNELLEALSWKSIGGVDALCIPMAWYCTHCFSLSSNRELLLDNGNGVGVSCGRFEPFNGLGVGNVYTLGSEEESKVECIASHLPHLEDVLVFGCLCTDVGRFVTCY